MLQCLHRQKHAFHIVSIFVFTILFAGYPPLLAATDDSSGSDLKIEAQKEDGLKYLEALARQNPIVRYGGTLNIMLTAAGEMAMAVSVNHDSVGKAKARGAPVDWARVKPYYGDLHPIALSAYAPRPNASKLFIDFTLSQEGQELMAGLGSVPARKGLKSKILRAEEIIPLDPALGEKMEYYQKLMKQTFVNNR